MTLGHGAVLPRYRPAAWVWLAVVLLDLELDVPLFRDRYPVDDRRFGGGLGGSDFRRIVVVSRRPVPSARRNLAETPHDLPVARRSPDGPPVALRRSSGLVGRVAAEVGLGSRVLGQWLSLHGYVGPMAGHCR
jgi:hypothetical protein